MNKVSELHASVVQYLIHWLHLITFSPFWMSCVGLVQRTGTPAVSNSGGPDQGGRGKKDTGKK